LGENKNLNKIQKSPLINVWIPFWSIAGFEAPFARIRDIKTRYRHTYILGGTGTGKTSLMLRMALYDALRYQNVRNKISGRKKSKSWTDFENKQGIFNQRKL